MDSQARVPRNGQSAQASCLTCRVVGSSVCAACSAYLTSLIYIGQPKTRGHMYGLAAGAVLFGALGIARAVA